jgi:iron complex transport system substrate-binding protein
LLEWPDPPFTSGHWNPELLALANGTPGPWDAAGTPSRTLTWDEINAFAPEMVVLLACGMDAYRALDESYALLDAPGWFDLPAVKNGECYAVDGSAYFNRPGPRLAESAEILATILHPETFTEMLPAYSVQRFDNELFQPLEDEEAAE